MTEEEKILIAVKTINMTIVESSEEGPFLTFETSGFWSSVELCGNCLWDDQDFAIPYADCGDKQVAESQEEVTAWLAACAQECIDGIAQISSCLTETTKE